MLQTTAHTIPVGEHPANRFVNMLIVSVTGHCYTNIRAVRNIRVLAHTHADGCFDVLELHGRTAAGKAALKAGIMRVNVRSRKHACTSARSIPIEQVSSSPKRRLTRSFDLMIISYLCTLVACLPQWGSGLFFISIGDRFIGIEAW